MILIEGERLRLRRAELADLDFIINLQYKPENLKFIAPYDRDYHTAIINSDGTEKMDIIIEEIATGNAVGYQMICDLNNAAKSIEWRHGIVDKKGVGYGRESFRLLMKWSFEIKKFHRGWLDHKTYNDVVIHLYESYGLKREGVMREYIFNNGVYEDVVWQSILDREYFAQL